MSKVVRQARVLIFIILQEKQWNFGNFKQIQLEEESVCFKNGTWNQTFPLEIQWKSENPKIINNISKKWSGHLYRFFCMSSNYQKTCSIKYNSHFSKSWFGIDLKLLSGPVTAASRTSWTNQSRTGQERRIELVSAGVSESELNAMSNQCQCSFEFRLY